MPSPNIHPLTQAGLPSLLVFYVLKGADSTVVSAVTDISFWGRTSARQG